MVVKGESDQLLMPICLFAVLLTLCAVLPAAAQVYYPDPGVPDTVRIGCPIHALQLQVGDSVAIPVFIVSDTKVVAFACGFTYNSDFVEIVSFRKNPAIFTGSLISQFQPHPETNSCLIGGITFFPQMYYIPPGTNLIGHLIMKLTQPTTGITIRIDSTFVPPAGPWVLSVDTADGNASFEIQPQYSHCDQCDVAINKGCPGCWSAFPTILNDDSALVRVGHFYEWQPITYDEDSPTPILTYIHRPSWTELAGQLLWGIPSTELQGYDSIVVRLADECNTVDIAIPLYAYTCGDIDISHQVDITDALCIVNYVFDECREFNHRVVGDVDCSNQTDITDAVYLINYIFGGGDPPCAGCK